MRTLEQALIEHELITLRVIGEWWELDLTGADKMTCVRALAQTLAGLDMKSEIRYLPPEEAEALQTLVDAGGRVPVAAYSRQHGEVRMMGPGRLEREEPWFDPESPAEALWYRGFLYRGFDEADDTMVEFYFVPHELLDNLPAPAGDDGGAIAIAPVSPPQRFSEAPTGTVDDLTTILSLAQREGAPVEEPGDSALFLQDADPTRYRLLLRLAVEQKLLRQTPEGLKPSRLALDWLQEGRESQLRALADAWQQSGFNELRHTPGIACEGSGWSNDPLAARAVLLETLPRSEDWYSIESLIATIKQVKPDFQRPDGNYDTWYIRDLAADAYITGFANWDLVEGRLLRFLIAGPMCWLGLVEVTADKYRLVSRALRWLAQDPPDEENVQVPLVVQPDATVLVPHNANRHHRFQAARFAEPEPYEAGRPYRYRITPSSLAQANAASITPERMLKFLAQAGGREVPLSTRRAIERWGAKGVEGRLQEAFVLRVQEPEILDTLLADQRTRPYMGERLGDLAVMISHEHWLEFRDATARLGLLLDLVE
jgi:hypothetical protein